MQQRREMDRRQEPRRETERDAAQPRSDDDEELETPETVPSFLTAQELQAPEPAKGEHDGEKPVGERRVLKERRRNPG